MNRLAIVGSRSFNDYERLREAVTAHCWSHFGETDEPREIVSGGASGADALAERYAKERCWPLRVIPADWIAHGRFAGLRRNQEIVRTSDHVIAFWDGKSRGTAYTIEQAKKNGVPCTVVRVGGEG